MLVGQGADDDEDLVRSSGAGRDIFSLSTRPAETYGIHLGDRVPISIRKYPEWCLAFIAGTCMGATAVLQC